MISIDYTDMAELKPKTFLKPHFAKNKSPFPLTTKILHPIYFHRELLHEDHFPPTIL